MKSAAGLVAIALGSLFSDKPQSLNQIWTEIIDPGSGRAPATFTSCCSSSPLAGAGNQFDSLSLPGDSR
jgi:hypothetical protein